MDSKHFHELLGSETMQKERQAVHGINFRKGDTFVDTVEAPAMTIKQEAGLVCHKT